MSIARKKIKKADKKIRAKAKDRIEPQDKGEVCVIENVMLVERVHRCDDECCCLI